MTSKYIIVAPCFNEEKAIESFLDSIEKNLMSTKKHFSVIIVDDDSTDDSLLKLKNYKFSSNYFKLKIIKLSYNSGHQEAIRQGLIFASKMADKVDGVIVMDSDGEDDPEAIKHLIKMKKNDIVFVSRKKRNENIKFKIGYFFYKKLFKLISGKSISFGNYSIISQNVLKSISHQKYFHFAAFLSKQKYDVDYFFFDRKKRIDGNSKMSYNNLIIHGLKSMVESSEVILIFLIKIFLLVFVLSIGTGLFILYNKFISHQAILGWTSSLGIGLVNACLIIFSTIIICLLVLSIKNTIIQDAVKYEEL